MGTVPENIWSCQLGVWGLTGGFNCGGLRDGWPPAVSVPGIFASAAKIVKQDSHQFLGCPRSLSSISA